MESDSDSSASSEQQQQQKIIPTSHQVDVVKLDETSDEKVVRVVKIDARWHFCVRDVIMAVCECENHRFRKNPARNTETKKSGRSFEKNGKFSFFRPRSVPTARGDVR
jgi:hypothetical protein